MILKILLLLLAPLSTAVHATEYPATLDWDHTLNVSTPLSGKVSRVKVTPGDRFKKNALLISLDRRPYQAALKSAEAELQRLDGSFKDAERELTRAKALFDRTVLSTTDLQTAELAFSTRQAEYNLAEAKLTRAKLDLEYSQVRAPFAGIVLEQLIRPGEVVINQCQATTMLRIAPTKTLVMRAQIPMAQRDLLGLGDPVSARILGNSHEGTVRKIGVVPQITPSGSNKFLVEVELPFSDTLLSLVGSKGTVEVP